jgi:hypothetical protein
MRKQPILFGWTKKLPKRARRISLFCTMIRFVWLIFLKYFLKHSSLSTVSCVIQRSLRFVSCYYQPFLNNIVFLSTAIMFFKLKNGPSIFPTLQSDVILDFPFPFPWNEIKLKTWNETLESSPLSSPTPIIYCIFNTDVKMDLKHSF